jgi:hypothetical protein
MMLTILKFTDLQQYPTPPDVTYIETKGYYEPGDGGAGIYKRVAAIPPNGGYGISATNGVFSLQHDGRVSVKQLGLKGDGVADDTAAVLNSLALATHVIVPPKLKPLIKQTIIVPAGSKLEFLGGLGNTTGAYPSSYFIKDAGLSGPGVALSERAMVSGGGIVCQPGNGGDGLNLIGNSAKAEYFFSYGAGRDGIRIGQDGVSGNYNSCSLFNCTTQYNGRYGLYSNDDKTNPALGANCNVATITQLFARGNGSDGIRLGFCFWTTLINCLSDLNGGYGLYLSSEDKNNYPANRWTTVIGGDYNEGNALGRVFDESYFSSFFGLDFNCEPAATTSPLQGSGKRIFIGSGIMEKVT